MPTPSHGNLECAYPHLCYTNSVHQTMGLSEKSAAPKSGVSSSHDPYPLIALIFNTTIHIWSQNMCKPPTKLAGITAFLWTQILLPSGHQTWRAGKSLSYGLLFQLKLPFSSWMSHSFPIFSFGFIGDFQHGRNSGDFPQVCYNCPIVYRRCPIVFLSFPKVIGDFP